MARKATVDRDRVLQMLREGESTQAVARYFGVSRQAIDLHRKEFILNDLLADKRASRKAAIPEEREEISVKTDAAIPLDRLIDLVIEAFDSLKRVPDLEAELEKCQRNYQAAIAKVELLEKEALKRKEQEGRWSVTMQPGDVNKPSNDR